MRDAMIVMIVLFAMTIFIMVFGLWFAGKLQKGGLNMLGLMSFMILALVLVLIVWACIMDPLTLVLIAILIAVVVWKHNSRKEKGNG